MRLLREAIPYAARTQAPSGDFVYKNHTDLTIRLHPDAIQAGMTQTQRNDLPGEPMEGIRHPEITTLRRIRSLSQFDDNQLQHLAAGLPIETAAPGQCLIDLGSCEKFSLYLLEGALRAVAHDRKETRFSSAETGELLQTGKQFEPELMTSDVELRKGATPYAAMGNWPIVGLCLVIVLGFWIRSRG